MLIGSEGILGVITEAWVRVHERPRHKLSCGVAFDSLRGRRRGGPGARAVGAQPVQLPPARRARGRAHRRRRAAAGRVLVLGFESRAPARRRADGPGARARPRPRRRTVDSSERASNERRHDAPKATPSAPGATPSSPRPTCATRFVACRRALRHLRDRDHLGPLRRLPRDRDRAAARARSPSRATAPRRGRRRAAGHRAASPTSTPTARRPTSRPRPGAARRRGRAVGRDQGRGLGRVIAAGGTITHHHAVGRDHRPWYDRQRPEPFAEALRAAKRAVDPAGDPQPRRAASTPSGRAGFVPPCDGVVRPACRVPSGASGST